MGFQQTRDDRIILGTWNNNDYEKKENKKKQAKRHICI